MKKSENILTIFGVFEPVFLPDFGVEIIAKIDTGAWNGALHATGISEKDGELIFYPLGNRAQKIVTKKFRATNVTSASGHQSRRYLIPLRIRVQNREYEIEIGLSDRSNLSHEIIVGRKFLAQNGILVDARKNRNLNQNHRDADEKNDTTRANLSQKILEESEEE